MYANQKRKISMLGALAILLMLFTLLSHQEASAKSDLVRLTIINKSDKVLTMRLSGPAFYYLMVQPETTRVFTTKRGEYKYTTFHCGIYTSGELDLNRQQKLLRRGCSDGDMGKGRLGNKKDLTEDVKIVKVHFKNEFSSKIYVTLYGPGTYVLPAVGDDTTTYTVARGEYSYWYFACGTFHHGTFNARDGRKLKLTDKACAGLN